MIDNLVQWLRDEASFAYHRAEEDMLTEAADRIEALEVENKRLANAWEIQHGEKVKERNEARLWFDKAQTWQAENERLRGALRVMIYETTHLSPMEPDGSHWCRITADALNIARAALEPKL